MGASDEALRRSFDGVAEIYDRIRPGYPAMLYERLFELLPVRPELLEVGPGTGQATIDLLRRGATITAVEIGEHLADFLEQKLRHPNLRVVRGGFEDVALPSSAFDGLVAATSYHWIRPPARLEKPATVLAPGGILAIVDTNQVASSADRGYFDRVQPIYERYGQARDKHVQVPTAGEVTPSVFHELLASPRYDRVELFRFPWDQRYTSDEYADLLRSYSGSQVMAEADRERLIGELCAVVDDDYGGELIRPLVITLTVARLVPES